MAMSLAFNSAEALGFIWVCRSVGEPGAKCMTVKHITVIPKRMGIMKAILFSTYCHIDG